MGRNPKTRMASTANASHCGRRSRGIAPKANTYRPQGGQRYDGKRWRASPAWAQTRRLSSAFHVLAGVVRLFSAPLFHQRLEIRVALLRQHDADGGEEVA